MKTFYKNEKQFQPDYIKLLKEEWYRVYKLPDVWYLLKPFDIFAVKDWVPYWIELKAGRVDTYDRIYRLLRPNQIGWLLHMQEHWGKSLIVWRDTKENKIYSYDFILQKSKWAL